MKNNLSNSRASRFLGQRWPLFAVLLVFTCLKIPHLFYPYYWDESWPYAAAVTQMYQRGVSLIPGAIDGELSRGHPLFFHAAGAAWMHVFGDSHFAVHCFALFIAVCCLTVVYEAGLKLFTMRVASLALILIAAQPIFFLQSAYLLPEILVALLTFLSLYCYVVKKYALTALCLAALFYTKESGLIMGLVLGIDAALSLFSDAISLRERLFRIAAITVPCALIAVFFFIQKAVNGWYVLPLYSGGIEHSWKGFWYKIRMGCIRDTFYAQWRYWYFLLLLCIAIVAAAKNKRIGYITVFLPAFCVYYYVDDMRAGRLLPSAPFFIVFILCIITFAWSLIKLNFFTSPQQKKITILSIAFVFAYTCFSATSYYIDRYMLAAIVPSLFIAAVALNGFIGQSYPVLFYPALTAIVIIGAVALHADVTHGETRHSLDGMAVQQKVTDFFETNETYDSSIASGSFLEIEHLKDPSTGFLKSGKYFKNVHWVIDKNTRYAVFDNVEPDYRYKDFQKDSSYQLVWSFQKNQVWARIYEKKNGLKIGE